MKKRILAIALVLVALLGCFVSCKKKNDTGEDISTFTEAQSSMLICNGFYYYVHRENVDDPAEAYTTIKYQNLNHIQEEGMLLYGDLLANEDPFRGELSGQYYMAVDEKATAENGGMPVLIIGYPYESGWNNLEGDKVPYKTYGIFSFNTANNQLTMLIGDMEYMDTFYISNGTIYFTQYLPIEGSEGQYGTFPYTMTTKGKNIQKYAFPDNLGMKLLGVWEEKLYYLQLSTGCLYTCNNRFENFELVMEGLVTKSSGKTAEIRINSPNPFMYNGYLYYPTGHEKITADGVDVVHFDIMRKSLKDPKEKEKMILEDVYISYDIHYMEGHFYYYKLDELQVVSYDGFMVNATSILHDFSLLTGKSSVVYDKSKENTKIYVSYINKDYYMNDMIENHAYHITDRKNGTITALSRS